MAEAYSNASARPAAALATTRCLPANRPGAPTLEVLDQLRLRHLNVALGRRHLALPRHHRGGALQLSRHGVDWVV